MHDREKVIKGLSCCAKWMGGNDDDACNNCPYRHSPFNYYDNDCSAAVNNDAIALLKEMEDLIAQLERDLAITQNNLNYYVNGND